MRTLKASLLIGRYKSAVSSDLSKNRAATRSASMRSPLAEASLILVHFDIAAIL
jgi:hypothetical protein